MGSDAGSTPVESDSSGPCEGPGCPQCQRAEDCAALGMPGATCVDKICWAPEPECKVEADCVARGPEYQGGKCFENQCRPNPRFRCERPSVEGNFTPVQLSTLVRDSLSLSPLKRVPAKVCQKLDLECATPVAETMTGDDGILRFTVPANFSGYLRVEASSYMPAIYAIPAALPKDGVLQPFPLLKSGVIADALAWALGSSLDRTRGHLMLISEDCMGTALAGVSFSSPQKDSRTVQFYVRDLLPSTDATSTGEVGNGGYLNFPAGAAVITVSDNPRSLRLATVSIVVKPGFVTVSYIRPDPR
jgi:hypothetical protein